MEKKEQSFKLDTTAKEFVPKTKERKSIEKEEKLPEAAPGAATISPSKLNPSAKEFNPKMPSPEQFIPTQPVVCFVPAYVEMEEDGKESIQK
jgi:hypothetical protein